MKNENGITILALIVTITIMTIIGFTVFYTAKGLDENVDDDVLIAELKTIKHIVLQEYNKKLTLGDAYNYEGTTELSTPDNATILGYKDNFEGIIYELDAEDLKNIGAKNATSTYWVCYDTGEVLNIDYTKSNGALLYIK